MSNHTERVGRYSIGDVVVQVLLGMISTALYKLTEKHWKAVREGLLWAGEFALFYLGSVLSLVLVTIFLTFPLDNTTLVWTPQLMMPWQSYFLWGIPTFGFTGILALFTGRQKLLKKS